MAYFCPSMSYQDRNEYIIIVLNLNIQGLNLNFSQKILKNREFESLRPRIWREIAERKPRVRENRELGNREVGGISV